jgi:hypothetical protein
MMIKTLANNVWCTLKVIVCLLVEVQSRERSGCPVGDNQCDRLSGYGKVCTSLRMEMNKPDNSQKVKIRAQTKPMSLAEKAERIARAYENLISVLNKHGYYPETWAEAKRIARELLTQGWEED